MPPSLLKAAGAVTNKSSRRYASIHVSKALHGLVTNRFAFQDPSTFIVERFYGGYQDCLLQGSSNVEVSPRNTWVTRPGISQYTTFEFPTPPLGGYSFNQNGAFTLFVDTASTIYSVTPTTGTVVFTKSPGSTQTSFLQLGGTLFFADSIDNKKIINGTVWNWGIDAPTTTPGVQVIESGSAATVWQAHTVFSTMGLTVDTYGQAWQLISVDADGTNSPNAQFGTSSNGSPQWNSTPPFATTNDGTVTWRSNGQILEWIPNTLYAAGHLAGVAGNTTIWDPTSQSYYMNFHGHGALLRSGNTKPPFNGVPGSNFYDGNGPEESCHWFWFAHPSDMQPWKQNHVYTNGIHPNTPTPADSALEPFLNPPPLGNGATPVYIQIPIVSGTSSNSYVPFQNGASAGTLQPDGQLQWLALGSSTWAATHSYVGWTINGTVFSTIKDQAGNMQVAFVTGVSETLKPGTSAVLSAAANASGGNTSYTGTFSTPFVAGYQVEITGFTTTANNGNFQIISCNGTTLVVNNPDGVAETHAGLAVFNPWGNTYGSTTNDNTVTWICVGPQVTWSGGQIWHLPLGGFIPSQPTDPFGGSTIVDSNNNLETVVSSGTSGSTHPVWGTNVGDNTTDNTITWTNEAAYSQSSLAWTKGYGWCYAFKARTATDFYVKNIPNGRSTPNGPPTGSADGSISSASPVFKLPTGPNAGAVVNLSGVGSLDPQVDTIIIFRCVDGFQGGPYFELTEFPAPLAIGGVAQPWTFQDTIADIDLNNLVEADLVGMNAPPPVGLTNICYTQGRVFGSVINVEYASSGSDIPPDNGNGLTGWNPSNNFPLTSPITWNISVNSGILAYTTTDEWSILGGPAITQFFPAVTRAGVGLLSRNAITQLGAEICLFTADRRLLMFIPGQGETEPGLGIADQFSTWDPSKVYLTLYENGLDKGLFLADGENGWFRLEAHSWPNNDPVWSPFATITGGCQMVQSIQTAPGVRSLLIGGTSDNMTLSKRNTAVHSDNGTNYASNFLVGGIPLCHDGEMAELGFITFTGPRIGAAPTVSYLLDEVAGTFTTMPSYVSDPPLLYGQGGAPTSVFRNRYYFKQTSEDISTITNTAANGTDATITAANDYAPGQSVTIASTTNGAGVFNGTFVILTTSSTEFTYALAHTVTSAPDSGTATVLVNPPVWCTDILINVAFAADGAAHEMARFTIFGGIYEDSND